MLESYSSVQALMQSLLKEVVPKSSENQATKEAMESSGDPQDVKVTMELKSPRDAAQTTILKSWTRMFARRTRRVKVASIRRRVKMDLRSNPEAFTRRHTHKEIKNMQHYALH